MQVIGAGLGRTGTLSLKHALEQLLGGPCYHMQTVVTNPAQLDLWYEWAQHPARAPRWDAILDGFVAGVDAPICFFWHDLMRRHPEAKVVLTVRDPERWYESFTNLMKANLRNAWMGLVSPRARRFGHFGRTMGRRFLPGMRKGDLLRHFRQHNERVREQVPAHRLLEMNIEDGWAPLCEFLDVPVPPAPFPHVNQGTDTIRRGHWQMAFQG